MLSTETAVFNKMGVGSLPVYSTTDSVKPQAAISSAIETQHNLADVLTDVIAHLKEKLGPVITVSPEVNAMATPSYSNNPKEFRSPLCDSIVLTNRCLENAISAIRAINESIEL